MCDVCKGMCEYEVMKLEFYAEECNILMIFNYKLIFTLNI